jgi:hypothetical protein
MTGTVAGPTFDCGFRILKYFKRQKELIDCNTGSGFRGSKVQRFIVQGSEVWVQRSKVQRFVFEITRLG